MVKNDRMQAHKTTTEYLLFTILLIIFLGPAVFIIQEGLLGPHLLNNRHIFDKLDINYQWCSQYEQNFAMVYNRTEQHYYKLHYNHLEKCNSYVEKSIIRDNVTETIKIPVYNETYSIISYYCGGILNKSFVDFTNPLNCSQMYLQNITSIILYYDSATGDVSFCHDWSYYYHVISEVLSVGAKMYYLLLLVLIFLSAL